MHFIAVAHCRRCSSFPVVLVALSAPTDSFIRRAIELGRLWPIRTNRSTYRAVRPENMEVIVTLDMKTSSLFDHRDPQVVKMIGERKAANI